MEMEQPQQQPVVDDDTYIKIWLADQDFVKTRWTITTFFMSVSFAILAYSFQTNMTIATALAIRVCGLVVYCFSVVMYLHFYEHNKFLRKYLIHMEKSGRATLDIQSKLYEEPRNKNQRSTSRWLIGLAFLYASGVFLLFLLHL
ncbi:hypothetical protein [Reticulibacter mediterranei]|uniref:hypothetical protein n=1 Tax=Reticulibacter mediterranei TaxID=2778369 RepID=UPI001C690666|nr:hypothetical protein [Reticulibacter mediterranei]